jgi:hypothetical protein
MFMIKLEILPTCPTARVMRISGVGMVIQSSEMANVRGMGGGSGISAINTMTIGASGDML